MLYNLKFWTDMEDEVEVTETPTGKEVKVLGKKPVDWVSYGPAVVKGVASNNVMVSDKVRRLDPANYKILPGQDGGMMMKVVRERWEAIEPAYSAWKEGREIPVEGTPLAAWTTLRSEEVDVLLAAKIRSVEMVSKMTDTQCSQLPLPNAWGLRDLALKFIETNTKEKDSAEIAELKAQIAHLTGVVAGATIQKVDPGELEAKALADELEARGIDYDKRIKNPEKLRAILNENGKVAA